MTEITDILDATSSAFAPAARSANSAFDHSRHDDRFRRLLSAEAWSRLPDVVRRRFSKGLSPNEQRIFSGVVVRTTLSRTGSALARLARLVGGPLPDAHGATGPSSVVVRRDDALGGQVWTRTYARPGRMPQTINSVKRFAGPTGLEEFLGHGLVMRLTLTEEAGDLVFRSAGYDILLGGLRCAVPRPLTPGHCTIRHRDEGHGRFSFTLTLDHSWLGRLVEQVAYYEEIV